MSHRRRGADDKHAHVQERHEGVLEDIVPRGPRTPRTPDNQTGGGDLVGIVRLESGDRVRVWNYHMAPAYATTVHKTQGSEYAHVVLGMFPNTPGNLRSREILYTSVTRARARLHVVGDAGVLAHMTSHPRRTVYPHVVSM